MSDLLASSSRWLHGKRKAFASSTVTYVRGEASVEVQATKGSTQVEAQDGSITIQSQISDWLIDVADLVLGAEQVEPARGDRIEEQRDGVTRRYEVMPVGPEGAWRYSGPQGVTYRIHSKFMGEA